MITPDDEMKTIGATKTAFDIVEAVARNDTPSVSEITEEVACSRSTVYYHLKTLEQSRYVFRDEDGYRLGLRMAHFSERAKRHQPLYGTTGDVLANLAEETGLPAFVGVQEGGKLVCFSCSSSGPVEGLPIHVGREYGLHCLAHGQAILSCLDESVVREIEATHGLARRTDDTLTDTATLLDRLETVEKVGIAYSAGEYDPGVSTIAAPVISESVDRVVGAIGVAGPTDQIDDPYKQAKARRFSDESPEQIRRAAQILSNHLHDD
ncbi:MAG: IclR family transcriptional regulator [Halosimplex sp.]